MATSNLGMKALMTVSARPGHTYLQFTLKGENAIGLLTIDHISNLLKKSKAYLGLILKQIEYPSRPNSQDRLLAIDLA